VSQDINTQQPHSAGGTTDTAREQAGEVGQRAKGEASEVAGHAKQEAGHVAEQAKQEMTHVADEARTQARNLYEDARGQLSQQASTQTDRVAGGMQQLASGMQALARGNPEESGPLGDYMEQLGGRLEHVARRIEDLGYEGVLDEVKRYARRRPGSFLMGAAATGLVLGRLVRGERDRQQQGELGRSGDTGTYRASGERVGPDEIDLRPAPGGGVVAPTAAPLAGTAATPAPGLGTDSGLGTRASLGTDDSTQLEHDHDTQVIGEEGGWR